MKQFRGNETNISRTMMLLSLLLSQQSWQQTVKDWILLLWVMQTPSSIILWLPQVVSLGKGLQLKRTHGSVWAERWEFSYRKQRNYAFYKSLGITKCLNSSSKQGSMVPDQETIETDFYLWAQKQGLCNGLYSFPWPQFLLPYHSSGCSSIFSSSTPSHRKVSPLYGNLEHPCSTTRCAQSLPTRIYRGI